MQEVLPEELAQEVKEAAVISMGTEINEEDISHIVKLCDEVISLTEYRGQLLEYCKNRLQSIEPDLTHLVGELVGARLIAHADRLLNLVKHPASTVSQHISSFSGNIPVVSFQHRNKQFQEEKKMNNDKNDQQQQELTTGTFSPNITLEQLRKSMKAFADERDWNQFHTPRNLLLALVGKS